MLTPEQASDLQRVYVGKRLAWYEAIGWPVKRTWKAKAIKPPPGELDADAVEEG